MIVDASVWVASFLPDEKHHQDAALFLRRLVESGVRVMLPTLALAEIGGAIARRSTDEHPASKIIAFIHAQSWIEFAPIDDVLGNSAAQAAIHQRLRGADAVYVALAAARRQPLITLDREMLERAPDDIKCMAPADWLQGK